MGKTILVTGKDSFLGNEISRTFLEKGWNVAVGVPPRKDALPSLEQDRRLLTVPWNRRSPVAAKNFVLQTVQDLGSLDEAWVLISPERETFALNDLPPLGIDEAFDSQVKGLVYLIRELLAYQAHTPQLALHFVFYEDDAVSLPPLAALHYFGLRGLVSSLLAQARKRGQAVWAYDSLLAQPDAYAAFLFPAKPYSPGRWAIFGEKKSLINSLFNKKDNA